MLVHHSHSLCGSNDKLLGPCNAVSRYNEALVVLPCRLQTRAGPVTSYCVLSKLARIPAVNLCVRQIVPARRLVGPCIGRRMNGAPPDDLECVLARILHIFLNPGAWVASLQPFQRL